MISIEEFTLARKRMVEEQLVYRGIHDTRVLEAMGKVARECFVPDEGHPWAYSDGPMPIGFGQTISQPYIVALMTELLEVQQDNRVLEVGCGSGYHAAILGCLAAEVHTLEMVAELACHAESTLAGLGYTRVHVHCGDGSNGWPEAAPYDRILVAAAAPEAPRPLLGELAEAGILVIPVGSRGLQRLEVWRRNGKDFTCTSKGEVCFVPLRGHYGWK